MKIFTELHHASLFRSFQILFEKRLNCRLYRPIGEEWFEKGYWKNAEIYSNHPDTIKQFLQIRNTVPTKMGPRNIVTEEREDYYLIEDDFMEQRALTFDQFCKMDIDVVIASYYPNIKPYKDLVKKYKPNAKVVAQFGNTWPHDWNLIDNLMSSTMPVEVPSNRKAVFYHQEFDTDIYRYEEPKPSNYMRSFVNCLSEHEINRKDWQDFQELEKLYPEKKFESYGISCRDGICIKQEDLAQKMRDSYFGVQLKSGGDGFGHCIHSLAAVGRPLIYRGSQYKGKLAEKLLEHRVTGLDLDEMSCLDVVKYIKSLTPGAHREMCEAMNNKFKQIDFEKESLEIKKFMEELI